MGKSKRIFKKRKGFQGTPAWEPERSLRSESSGINEDSGSIQEPGPSTIAQPEPSNEESGLHNIEPGPVDNFIVTPSTSRGVSPASSAKSKVSVHLADYDVYENNEFYDICSISKLSDTIMALAICKYCSGKLQLSVTNRVGLASKFQIKCLNCEKLKDMWNCKIYTAHAGNKRVRGYEMNLRAVYAFRSVGKGQTAMNTACSILNLHTIRKIKTYESTLHSEVEKLCKESMANAVKEAVDINEGSRDLCIALDGSWQKRGHTSLNGVVTATSVDSGKAIDVAILSKYCLCPQRHSNVHLESCAANYMGVSGGMEVAGVSQIFNRSQELYGVRYIKYLGDGDSKAFKTVLENNPYGPNCAIEKLECIGHIQKRMGSRLRTLKQKFPKQRLSDNKTLGGKNRLTNLAIDKIQNYYANAIRKNNHSLDAMKKAVWSVYFHIASTNEEPCHTLCDDAWCKYKKAVAEGQTYNHLKHFHLSPVIMNFIKPIFRDLSHPNLLVKCLHGKTQNPNESLNNIIWTRVPKRTFVSLKTLELGVYDAVLGFNEGNIYKCHLFRNLNIDPGQSLVNEMKNIDKERIRKNPEEIVIGKKKSSKARKKLENIFQEAEDPEDPAYGPGLH